MKTVTDSNSGLGYGTKAASDNAARWQHVYPNALVTLSRIGAKWVIVIDFI